MPLEDNIYEYSLQFYKYKHCSHNDAYRSDVRQVAKIASELSAYKNKHKDANIRLLLNRTIIVLNAFGFFEACHILRKFVPIEYRLELDTLLYSLSADMNVKVLNEELYEMLKEELK